MHGYTYILDNIDVYSRYTMIIPLKIIGTRIMVNKLFKRWITIFWMLKVIYSDNGLQFKSEFVREFVELHRSRTHLTNVVMASVIG